MKLLVVSGKDVIKALSKIGYYVRDQKGSHVHLKDKDRTIMCIPLWQWLIRKQRF